MKAEYRKLVRGVTILRHSPPHSTIRTEVVRQTSLSKTSSQRVVLFIVKPGFPCGVC